MSKIFQGTKRVSKSLVLTLTQYKKVHMCCFFHGKLSRVRLRIIPDKKIKATLKQNMTTTGFLGFVWGALRREPIIVQTLLGFHAPTQKKHEVCLFSFFAMNEL